MTTNTRASSARKPRSPSPAKTAPTPKSNKKAAAAAAGAGSAAKPKSAGRGRKPKAVEEEEVTEDVIAVPTASKRGRSRKPAKEEEEAKVVVPEEDDEEITSLDSDEDDGAFLIINEDEVDLDALQDALRDSTALHNVLRVQYLQMYALGFALIASSISPTSVPTVPFFKDATPVVKSLTGAISLSQAFSLTAAAQTSFSGMRKNLQYNMFFHLLFAFLVIFHNQEAKGTDLNLQVLVVVSCLNVGVNLWACYFRREPEEDETDDEAETE